METNISEFKVRTVGLAARCEVCHQDDLFNAETGECARCSGTLAEMETFSAATVTTEIVETDTSPSLRGRGLARAAAILSALAAVAVAVLVPAILLRLLTFSSNNRTTGDWLSFLAILSGFLGVIGVGFCLLHWYWKVGIGTTRSNQRKTLWSGSAIYNGLLIPVLIYQLPVVDSIDPISVVWLGLLEVMTVISGLALLEEYRPR